jgi:hypothetical protein
MRVVFVVNSFPRVSEMFIANLAAGLVRSGVDLDILCMRSNGTPEVLNAARRSAGLLERRHISNVNESS